MSNGLFDSLNAAYAQALYEEFARNPEAVPPEWRDFFAKGQQEAVDAGLLTPEALVDDGHVSGRAAVPAPAPAPTQPPPPPPAPSPTPAVPEAEAPAPTEPPALSEESVRHLLSLVARGSNLLQAFREHGHQAAAIDPLGSEPAGHPQLDPSYWGTTMEALEAIPSSVLLPSAGDEPLALTLDRLRATYCQAIGYEFEHLEDPHRVEWLWEQVEGGFHFAEIDDEERRWVLDRLVRVEGLEQFLHRAYLGQKRFSIEGTDMMVPMIDEAIELAAADGATEVVIGMAHRGRLNVLAHVVEVSYEEVLGEFEGRTSPTSVLSVPDPGTGDVKYHHGAVGQYRLRSGEDITVTLAPNPSHLEYVNPVVLGMARARQQSGEDGGEQDFRKVVPILIHGDAAFAAEGVVAETLNLARLKGYDVGGTIHIIANNQVGFTTDPVDGRSTRYSSDLAKGYDIPIVHVNGDRPESCLAAVHLAMAYRREFADDMVIDLVGYRRHGHNEGDEPAYTQPTLYAKIDRHPTVRTLWTTRLVESGVVTEAEIEALVDQTTERLRDAQTRVKSEAPERDDNGTDHVDEDEIEPKTAVSLERISRLNEILLDFKEGFTVHPKLARQLSRRGTDFGPDFPLAWGHAEALAFASLLEDGVPVRLSGQDSQRGTFSHRHLVLHDAETGETDTPIERVAETRFEVYNSPLTEAAVIGFEYGFAVARDGDLVMWEAQFGDFVNVAQVMIDQFISAGWTKWGQRSRLTLLLPHGYEGQGPEHSSARIERFLQLCAEDNMRVVYPTTPGQYFHLLRRQALSEPERPLVVMTPKSLLRHPMATTPVSVLTDGSFQSVMDDASVEDPLEIRRLILCSGKVYYDLVGSELRKEAATVAIARVEALYPFPEDEISSLAGRYPNLEEIIWCQEEPGNMGALSFVGPRLRAAISRTVRLRYVARPERASPAEGHAHAHIREQTRLVQEALTG